MRVFKTLAWISAFSLFVTLLCPSLIIHAAESDTDTIILPPQPRGQYVGFLKCAECHYQQEVRADHPEDEMLLPRDFINRTEVRTWYNQDQHKTKAFAALRSPLGEQIGALLGKASLQNSDCLSCHSSPSARDQAAQAGVACEACHGPGSGWLFAHADPTWRTKSTNEKQQFGMVDMRNASVKAKQCMSCHVGSAAEKKLVTHEMYAAGHPPLQGVEIEQQISRMPAHWKNLSEKKPEIQNLLRFDRSENYRTKSVLLGGVLAYRTWLGYLTDRPGAKSPSVWTDFAVYECYSCHHDLQDTKVISWRQKRGFTGVAGQPPLATWPQVLVRLAIFQSSGGKTDAYKAKLKEFNDKVDRVARAYNGKAFSAQKAAALPASEREAAANDLTAWLDRLAGEIQNSRVDRAATVRLMQTLASDAQETLDYSSARQVGSALASMSDEIQTNDAKVSAAIAEIKNSVGLQTKDRVLVAKWQAPTTYDPERFRAQLSRLAQLIK